MAFSTSVANEVLVRCGRHCCLCVKYAGMKMELHHIKQVSDGGDDSIDNCIPLCFDCHAEVKSYNPHHPKGRLFTEKELKGHRDKCYRRYSSVQSDSYDSNSSAICEKRIFPEKESKELLRWGYPEQDQICPLIDGELVMIAGCTGAKKSTYIHHVINTNLKAGYRVAYCCVKDKPFDVGLEIIAEDAQVNVEHIKRGVITDDVRNRIEISQNILNNRNLALFPYDQVAEGDRILQIVENSGAEIIVIDDINGVSFDNNTTIEKFLYQLRNTAAKHSVVVFVVCNLKIPERIDRHPMVEDFPVEGYYRLFDIVHLLYKCSNYDTYEEDKEKLEIIIVKGALSNPHTIKLVAPNNITGVFSEVESVN